jgi:ABC-type multidrug transport system fused ATPase/permease subunit
MTSCPAGHRLHRARTTCCCSCSALRRRRCCCRGCRATCSTASCSARCSALRSDVEDKLNRLPLRYFDRQPRGELLSRVTNDIDNIAQSLQQTLSQLLTSLLTVVGVLAMMFWISPLLALVALITIPLSIWSRASSPSARSRKFVAQWKHTGTLNAQVEEAFTGHALVKVFGRQREVEAAKFATRTRSSTRQLRRAVHLRHHHAGDDVHREPQLRRHRGGRRPAGRLGQR